MAMMHDDLVSYYERIFAFKQYHQWNISEIEELIPWEFEVMTSLLSNYLESIEMQRKQSQVSSDSMG